MRQLCATGVAPAMTRARGRQRCRVPPPEAPGAPRGFPRGGCEWIQAIGAGSMGCHPDAAVSLVDQSLAGADHFRVGEAHASVEVSRDGVASSSSWSWS